MLIDNKIQNQEIKSDRKRDTENAQETPDNSFFADYIDKILVISSGTLLSLSLLLLIGREIIKLRRLEFNNTSDEMNEFHSIFSEEQRAM